MSTDTSEPTYFLTKIGPDGVERVIREGLTYKAALRYGDARRADYYIYPEDPRSTVPSPPTG